MEHQQAVQVVVVTLTSPLVMTFMAIASILLLWVYWEHIMNSIKGRSLKLQFEEALRDIRETLPVDAGKALFDGAEGRVPAVVRLRLKGIRAVRAEVSGEFECHLYPGTDEEVRAQINPLTDAILNTLDSDTIICGEDYSVNGSPWVNCIPEVVFGDTRTRRSSTRRATRIASPTINALSEAVRNAGQKKQ